MLAVLLFVTVPYFEMYAFSNKNSQAGWKEKPVKNGWIVRKLKQMTVEEKVGQLFMVHVYGKTPSDPNYEQQNIDQSRGGKNFAEVIENYHIGGVIYFNWNDNIGTPLDPAQVNALSNGLQRLSMDKRSKIPLLIATDQEGGVVARVRAPGTVFPGNMALGATRSEQFSRQTAEIMGNELKSLGINTNFAPDLDVNVNPENPVIGVRSFSEDPELVTQLGQAQINGYQSENLLATAKHFPGHGDTNVDSHSGLPIINHDWNTLWNVDLRPFRAAIDSGVDAIMTAHIVVPALDNSGLPATLSKPILTGLLREKMNYDGLIITDSLGMSGANILPPEKVPVEAFKAGADILLNPPDVPLAYNAVLSAVQSGEISKKRLDQSVYRILKAKMERGLFDNPYTPAEAIRNIGIDEHLKIARTISAKSVTLVKNDNHVLPLSIDQRLLITGPDAGKPDLLSELLAGKGFKTAAYATSTTPSANQTAAAVDRAGDADVIIVPAYSANINVTQPQFVRALQETGKPVVVASMRNPYDLPAFPDVDANVLTYGNQDVSVQALADVLEGSVEPTGRLPVTIPGLYEYGHGLSY